MISWLSRQLGQQEAMYRDAWRRTIWLQDRYEPTPAQANYLFDPLRVKQVSGGVRAGKSYSAGRSCDWYTCVPDGLVWIIGPDYKQARKEFKYMLEPYRDAKMLAEPPSMPKEGSWTFTVDGGATVETISADTLEKIAGDAPDAMLVVEAGQMDDGIRAKVLERGLEKNAYILFCGTFEGAFSWYADQWSEWQAENALGAKSYSLPTWSNTYIFPDGEDDPRFKEFANSVPEDIYKERIEAVPYKPSGLVFGQHYDVSTHVVSMSYDPKLPVEIAIDPATHTYALLFVQWEGENVHVLDEVYMHDIITQDFIPYAKAHWLWPKVTGGVIDVAGKQRQANYSVMNLWQKYAKINLRASKVGIEEGIEAMKLRLNVGPDGSPRLLFSNKLSPRRDAKGRSNGVLSEMSMYRWPKQPPNGNTRRKPIDAHNDGVKALVYWLIDRYGYDVLRDSIMDYETKATPYPWMQTI